MANESAIGPVPTLPRVPVAPAVATENKEVPVEVPVPPPPPLESAAAGVPVKFACPACQKVYRFRAVMVGRKLRCIKCNHVFTLPYN